MELPFETYERLLGEKWPGGTSLKIQRLLILLGIKEIPGTAKANLKLQKKLFKSEKFLKV